MTDVGTAISLVFVVSTGLYILVAVAAGSLRGTRALAVLVGAAVVAVWVLLESPLAIADLGLPLLARRAGVVLSGAAAVLSYVSIRRNRIPPIALMIAAPVLLAAGAVLAASNWIVGVACLVIGAGGAPMRRGNQEEEA